MNRTILYAAIGALLLAQPALAQSMGEKTGLNKMTGVAPKTEDFVKEAALSDMFEIQSSKLAQEKGSNKDKAFAAKMIQDHSQTTDELKSLVSGGKVNAQLPADLDSSHKSKLDKLNGLSGKDFSKRYDSDQVSGHKDAVSLFRRYAKGGDNPDLKAFAAKYLPHIQEHLKMAQDLRK